MLSLSRVSNEGEVAFPDTVVDMNTPSASNRNKVLALNEEDSYTIIGDLPTLNKAQRAGKGIEEIDRSNPPSKKTQDINDSEKISEKNEPPTAKRGHKGKMKKIKEKYKDQDEDERQLKMELLQVFIAYDYLTLNLLTVCHVLSSLPDPPETRLRARRKGQIQRKQIT